MRTITRWGMRDPAARYGVRPSFSTRANSQPPCRLCWHGDVDDIIDTAASPQPRASGTPWQRSTAVDGPGHSLPLNETSDRAPSHGLERRLPRCQREGILVPNHRELPGGGRYRAISLCVNVAAALFFLFSGKVIWSAAAVMAMGASWAPIRGTALAGLGVVADAYSVTSELALMSASRGDLAAERLGASETGNIARDRTRTPRRNLLAWRPLGQFLKSRP